MNVAYQNPPRPTGEPPPTGAPAAPLTAPPRRAAPPGTAHSPDASADRAAPASAADAAPGGSDALQRCLQALAAQPARAAAMQRLATELQQTCGAAVVRAAWGNHHRLRRIFDTRLGTLGTESSLWREVSDRWSNLTDGPAGWVQSDGVCVLRLPQPDGPGRALLWFPDRLEGGTPQQTILSAAPTIAAVLWSRPPVRLPLSWCGDRRKPLILAAAGLLMLVIGLLPVPYRVACTARVEPVHQRIVAAPFEAALLDCYVQPGDRVAAGDLLVVLDGRPLQLEMEALQADLQQATKQHDAALATGRVADAQLADLERRQLQRRIDLLQQRLVGLEVRSPIDGVVVSGDLHRSIGAPVETGQQLLEIAPLERMTMEVEIPERDVRYVAAGAAARVRLDSAAIRPIDGRLQVLYPAAELRDDRNVFVGQWQVDNGAGDLRPGMRGTAVVYGPRRPLIWPTARRLSESALRTIGW